MARKGYRGISLALKICDEIDKIIAISQYGYVSRADFIKDAVRRRIIELNNLNSSNDGCKNNQPGGEER